MAFDPDVASVEQMLRTIRSLDYEPEVVDRPTPRGPASERIDPAGLPGDLRELLRTAEIEGRPLLVQFSGPG